jgi:hypothetical protein
LLTKFLGVVEEIEQFQILFGKKGKDVFDLEVESPPGYQYLWLKNTKAR